MSLKIKIGAIATLATASLFGATEANAADIANPSGVLLDTKTAEIGVSPLTLDLNNSDGWLDNGDLAGNSDCNFDRSGSNRVYQKLELKVVKSGTYTFRIVGTNPEFGGDYTASPIQDPFLALYSTFDPGNLDAGVVGCNDDEYSILGVNRWDNGDKFPTNGEDNTNDRWSHFSAELTPGNYTVILSTWGPVTTDDWAEFAPQSAVFEYWGPDCGIEGGNCALAETGYSPESGLLAAIGLLAIGGTALFIRRRPTAK